MVDTAGVILYNNPCRSPKRFRVGSIAQLGCLLYTSILGEAGCPCSQMVFDHSSHRPQVTAGVLREESLAILEKYFSPKTDN